MSKEDIRNKLKERRSKLSKDEIEIASKQIVPRFSKIPHGYSWLLYSPIQNELPTHKLFDWIRARGDQTYYPRVAGENLEFHLVNKLSELKKGKWTLEPLGSAPILVAKKKIIIVIPGIAFSPEGFRLGFGKGFYDRFLTQPNWMVS